MSLQRPTGHQPPTQRQTSKSSLNHSCASEILIDTDDTAQPPHQLHQLLQWEQLTPESSTASTETQIVMTKHSCLISNERVETIW